MTIFGGGDERAIFVYMQMPEYDYSLGKMAGLGEMPGISNIIKRSAHHCPFNRTFTKVYLILQAKMWAERTKICHIF